MSEGRSGWQISGWLDPWHCLLPVPVLVLLFGILVSACMGPFWVFPRLDSDYAYLLNGLNLAQGHGAWHVDHPGTPVQAMVGAVIIVTHTFSVWTGVGAVDPSMTRDVIARPEMYLMASHIVILLLAAGSSLAFGLAALRASGSWLCALVAQAASIATMTMFAALLRVNPEPVLFSLAMLLGAAGLLCAAGESGADEPRHRRLRSAALLGLLVGLGVAVKVTFAPAALVALSAVRGGRQWLTFAAVFGVTLALATVPAWHRLGYLTAWIWRNVEGTGSYGRGPKTYIDRGQYPADLLALLKSEPVLPVLAVASFLFLMAVCGLATFAGVPDRVRRLRTLLAGILGAQFLLVLIVAKHPEPRYLVPALALMGPALVAMWVMAAAIVGPGNSQPRRWFGRAMIAALLLVVTGAAAGALRSAVAWPAALLNKGEHLSQLARAVEDFPDFMIVYEYGCSSEAYALWFGNSYAGRRYCDLIMERFPNEHSWGVVGPELVSKWAGRDQLLLSGHRPLGSHFSFETILHLPPPETSIAVMQRAHGPITARFLERGGCLRRVWHRDSDAAPGKDEAEAPP